MSLLTLLQGNNGAGSLIWNLKSWCSPTAPVAPTTSPRFPLARRLSRWLIAIGNDLNTIWALRSSIQMPLSRWSLTSLPQATLWYPWQRWTVYMWLLPTLSAYNIFYLCEINFYFFSFKLLGVPLHLLHMTRLLLEWKKSKKQEIMYCLIRSAYKIFTLFHPSKCTKWKIKSLCFFCVIAEEM